MMDRQNFERRRVLQAFTLGSIAVTAAMLGGCAAGSGARPPRQWQGGGSSGKDGKGGGPGGGGNHGSK